MIAEFGHFALILAFCVAVVLGIWPLVATARGDHAGMVAAKPMMLVTWLLVAVAYAALTLAFIGYDFSVRYVANNANLALPLLYRVSGVWAAHEGSLLLWILMLVSWGAAVSMFGRALPLAIRTRVLGVIGLLSTGFLAFTLFTSNPFERILPAPADGRDLNPLLQDPGLAIHPPMLYMGYVGFAVAFAFAIAALLDGRLDAAWARWTRPWTNAAWASLTLGITLGSWWAYNELGWGGWWFWDPVENASFMPWLAGTALVHSLAATEKRGVYKSWTVLLAISAFSLSLLGTFLVRSGVINSVHAFASDPGRGVFILAFLALVIGGSLSLFAWRAPSLKADAEFSTVSRESGLLLNNVLLVVATGAVLLGTLYPIALDALGLGKISVGPPYFDTVMGLLMAPLAAAVAVGARLRWKNDSLLRALGSLRWPGWISIAAGVLLPVLGPEGWTLGAAVGIALGVWVMSATIDDLAVRSGSTQGNRLQRLRRTPRAVFGMSLAHFGIGVFVIGVCLTHAWSSERDVSLRPGESQTLSGYTFQFDGVSRVSGPNYDAQIGTVRVSKKDRLISELKPEKRRYSSGGNIMTEAGVDIGLTRDLYVSLGEPTDEQGAWSMRFHHKAFIRWIWLGALLMAAGGIVAVTDKRYRATARKARQLAMGDRVAAAS